MKIWIYSLRLSIFSCGLLVVMYLLPRTYGVFIWSKSGVDPGILFPVLLVSWTAALFGFALNNIFIDKSLIDKKVQMPESKKYLPSLLAIPAIISFGWFIYRWYNGDPNS